MEERGHVPRCSQIIELNLYLWWLRLQRSSISDLLITWLISNIVINLLDSSLDFNVFIFFFFFKFAKYSYSGGDLRGTCNTT